MEWELAQTFIFAMNARDVCTHIMGKSNWQEDNHAIREVSDGLLALRVALSVSQPPKALYSVMFMGQMSYGTQYNDDHYAEQLLPKRAEVAEIVLTQEVQGKCKAELYILTTPSRWGSDRTSLWRTGPLLVGKIWNDIISNWLNRDTQDVATVTNPETKKRWTPRGEADRWLIQQFFEVYKEKRQSAYFVDEWLRMRWELDGKSDEPIDPANSVRKIIFKERGERKRYRHQ